MHEAEYQPEGHHESQLIESLEPDQLVAAVAKPLTAASIEHSH